MQVACDFEEGVERDGVSDKNEGKSSWAVPSATRKRKAGTFNGTNSTQTGQRSRKRGAI